MSTNAESLRCQLALEASLKMRLEEVAVWMVVVILISPLLFFRQKCCNCRSSWSREERNLQC